jgi:hypothetical protein
LTAMVGFLILLVCTYATVEKSRGNWDRGRSTGAPRRARRA